MKLQLTNGAVVYLRSAIEAVGWAKSTDLVYRGGQLLCETLPAIEPREDPNSPASRAWMKELAPEFEISDKLFETCQTALRHHAGEAKVACSPVSFELLKTFKLSPS